MSLATTDIPGNPEALGAFIADMQAKLAASGQVPATGQEAHDATRSQVEAARNAVGPTTLEIEKLKMRSAWLRRMKFGQSSERLALLADQLKLTLEDVKVATAHAYCVIEGAVPAEMVATARRKPKRESLPAHLPRDGVVHLTSQVDDRTTCGGRMSALGENVTEVLEYVPGRFRIVRHIRLKLACDCCNAVSQAFPLLSVPRGRSGPELLAHVAQSKLADHLPL